MILLVDVVVVKAGSVEAIGSENSLRSAQQRVAFTHALVLCYHPPTAGMPSSPGMPRAWLKRRRCR
eukprot:6045328-Pleurochrysis_carterae.AAC.1